MNPSADAADQIVRVSWNGTKYIVHVTSKRSKEAAEKLAKAMIAAMKQKNKKTGSMRKGNLIKSGIRLDITDISISDIRRFAAEARKYGVLYTVVKDKTLPNGYAQLMYRSTDKEKVNMIFQHLGRPPEYFENVRESISKELKDRASGEKKEKPITDLDAFVDELMRKPEPEKKTEEKSEKELSKDADHTKGEPSAEDPTTGNPSRGSHGKTRKKRNRSDSISGRNARPVREGSRSECDRQERRSVREELAEIKADMERKAQEERNRSRNKTRTINHKDPGRKKPKKEKER